MKKGKCITIIILSIFMAWVSAYGGEKDITYYDGNQWLKFSENVKMGFVTGFIAGASALLFEAEKRNRAIDNTAIVWELKELSELDKRGLTLRIPFMKFPINRFELYNITVGQLCDGLNKFYRDYRNRNIEIKDAIYIVKTEIRGEDPEWIKNRIRWLRKPKEERDKLFQKYLEGK